MKRMLAETIRKTAYIFPAATQHQHCASGPRTWTSDLSISNLGLGLNCELHSRKAVWKDAEGFSASLNRSLCLAVRAL